MPGGSQTSSTGIGVGVAGADELLVFIPTEARTTGNELALQQERLKLDIRGEHRPNEQAGEIMEPITERSVEVSPEGC